MTFYEKMKKNLPFLSFVAVTFFIVFSLTVIVALLLFLIQQTSQVYNEVQDISIQLSQLELIEK